MARLRVGDIVIEDDRVSIGGVPLTGAPAAAPPEPAARPAPPLARPAPVDPLAAAGTVPLPWKWLFVPGVVALGAGLLWLALTPLPLGIATFVLRGGLVASAGGALALLGLLKRGAERREARLRREQADAELAPHLARLGELLREPKEHQTVEWIMREAALPEATVLRALARLQERGALREELAASGEWYYWVVPGARSLGTRLKELEGGRS